MIDTVEIQHALDYERMMYRQGVAIANRMDGKHPDFKRVCARIRRHAENIATLTTQVPGADGTLA